MKKSESEDQLEVGPQTLEARLWKAEEQRSISIGCQALKDLSNGSGNVRRSMDVTFIEGQQCMTTTPLPSTFPCALYEATVVPPLKKSG